MARPPLYLSPAAQAMWEDLCARWEAGILSVPEICTKLEISDFTAYKRLHEAQQRIELRILDANQAARDAKSQPDPQGQPQRPGAEPTEDGTFLAITDDPRELIRPYRDYSRDEVHGEEAYRQRDYYCVSSTPEIEFVNPHDATSMDERGGPVLVGSGAIRYDSSGAGRMRLPSPPLAGQRLRRNRLGTGNRAEPGGPTATPESDGLAGGTDAAPADEPIWRVIGDDDKPIRVKAKSKADAKRAVKRLLGMASSEPLPAGVRFCREG